MSFGSRDLLRKDAHAIAHRDVALLRGFLLSEITFKIRAPTESNQMNALRWAKLALIVDMKHLRQKASHKFKYVFNHFALSDPHSFCLAYIVIYFCQAGNSKHLAEQ